MRRPLRGVALLLGMADAAGSAEENPDSTSDLGRTCTATGHRKCSSSQTVAQRKEGLAAKRLRHIPFFILLYIIHIYFIITHFLRIPSLLLLILQIHKLLQG